LGNRDDCTGDPVCVKSKVQTGTQFVCSLGPENDFGCNCQDPTTENCGGFPTSPFANTYCTNPLTYEGIGFHCNIQNFYNGGTDSCGESGPNYGVQLFANAEVAFDGNIHDQSDVCNMPSPSSAGFFLWK